MSEQEIKFEQTKKEKYLAIKELLIGFSVTEASEIVDYFARQIRKDTKVS